MIKYLSPAGAWAFAFGCAVGWGSFVMPGTTFLPTAGPLGTVIGLVIGALIMVVIGVNYSKLISRYPGPGGSYTYASKVLGNDHGFVCAWMLLLAYTAVLWANATALSLIVRYVIGDIFCFGFSYEIAGYTVYLGEVLLSFGILLVATLLCVFSKRAAKWFQIIMALALFILIAVCFIAVVIHRGGFSGIEPPFKQGSSPAWQVLGILMLAPWAFIGFESISHSSGEFKFSPKKSLPIMIGAIAAAALAYIMLVLCASMAVPDGYTGWSDYIRSLSIQSGINQLPTFFAAKQAMGDTGVMLLGIAAFCGIATGVIGNMIAVSRLMYSMADDGILPKVFIKRNKSGIPWAAILCVAGVSAVIPLSGRTAIGWIVDITTVCALIVYGYVSICSLKLGLQEKKRFQVALGIIGAVLSFVFAAYFLFPDINARGKLSSESIFILIVWSVLGILVFRTVIKYDKTRTYGKSQIVLAILFLIIMIVTITWIHQTTVDQASKGINDINSHYSELEKDRNVDSENEVNDGFVQRSINEMMSAVRKNIYIQDGLILCAIVFMFSILAIINKREKESEAERLAAEEKSKAKTMFLSNMSHDIRTPLNAVTGYTELALEEENLPDNIRDYLEKIDYSGKHLLILINDILDMTRIESGKVKLNTEPSDWYEIIDETVGLFVIETETKKMNCSVDYSTVTDRYVICDKNRISRILLNLLSNAFKFTPTGGKIDVVLRQNGVENGMGSYEFSVADTGIGMSPEFVDQLFVAFERERTQTVSKVQGTGLGMTITKTLVDLMGGSITVETEQNKGTKITVSLQLPLTGEQSVKKPKSQEQNLSEFNGKRVLLAEDNAINREIASEILTRGGFEVECAENGKEAVEMIGDSESGRYSAILMDIQMPVMNGYEAAKAIRSMDGEKSDIPIIALTANTFENDKADALEAGMNAHIAKPIEPAELFAAIAEVIKSPKE